MVSKRPPPAAKCSAVWPWKSLRPTNAPQFLSNSSHVLACPALLVLWCQPCCAVSHVVVSAMLWCQPWRLLLVVPVGKWASRSEASDRIDELAAALAAQLALQQASFTSR